MQTEDEGKDERAGRRRLEDGAQTGGGAERGRERKKEEKGFRRGKCSSAHEEGKAVSCGRGAGVWNAMFTSLSGGGVGADKGDEEGRRAAGRYCCCTGVLALLVLNQQYGRLPGGVPPETRIDDSTLAER